MSKAIKKMMMIALSAVMVLALAACGGGSSSDSEGGKLAAIQEKGKIVVCTDAAWAPFEYIGEGGQPTGIDIEIAQYIADHPDCTCKRRCGSGSCMHHYHRRA